MNSRWIDQYLLRYAVGSIVGAAIVAYVFIALKKHGIDSHFGGLDTWGKVTMIGAFGLAFCYIASAPLLVFHVARTLLFSKAEERKHRGTALTSTVIGIAWIFCSWVLGFNWNTALVIAAVVGLFTLELILLTQMMRKVERHTVYQFYEALSRKRKSAEKECDIVESFRGIREHGNAYAILTLEAALGVVLGVVINDRQVMQSLDTVVITFIALLAFWITPAGLVLYTAARIENDFVDNFVPTSLPDVVPAQPTANLNLNLYDHRQNPDPSQTESPNRKA